MRCPIGQYSKLLNFLKVPVMYLSWLCLMIFNLLAVIKITIESPYFPQNPYFLQNSYFFQNPYFTITVFTGELMAV